MKLELLLTMVALVSATLARLWGGRDDDVARPDDGDPVPVGPRVTFTTITETIGDTPTDGLITVSTVVFVEHLYTTPGISTWLNWEPDSWTSTSTTFTTTTVTHIPHIIYSTDTSDDESDVPILKRSTVSITDWVTVTRDPDNPDGTTGASSSSETLTSTPMDAPQTSPSSVTETLTSTPMDAPQTPPFSVTAATSTASLSSSESLKPDNSSMTASQSPSSTSAVSGAPPINSTSEASVTTVETSSSKSLEAPPAPITSTAPIPSESLTMPNAPSSPSESQSSPSEPPPVVGSSDMGPPAPKTSSRHPHASTLRTLTTGFSAPVSSTLTFIVGSHKGTHLSMESGTSSEEPAIAVPTGNENQPPGRDEAPSSVTAPFTLTLTAPPASSVRCDDSWCSNDGTSYCMRWDGISGTNSYGMITPGEVFTTIGLCTKSPPTGTQVTTDDGTPTPAVSRLRPSSNRMRLV